MSTIYQQEGKNEFLVTFLKPLLLFPSIYYQISFEPAERIARNWVTKAITIEKIDIFFSGKLLFGHNFWVVN